MAVIECAGLSKRYGSVDVLADLTLDVDEGEVFGFLGPNGAGKTTTVRLLLGLIRPTAGSATVFGLDARSDAVAIHRRLAYVPGEAALWPSLTGEETLHLLARLHGTGDDAYGDLLVERFDFDPRKKVRAYSKGNRQKVVLIAALASRADLLVLDEPTSGLDPLMEQAFRAFRARSKGPGQTIFLSSHILSEVEALCDRIGILRDGRLVEEGTMDELRHLSAVTVEITFGDDEPPRLDEVPGVDAVEVTGRRVRCQVRGSMDPLLKALATADVHELISHEPSLEELFLVHYGQRCRLVNRATATVVGSVARRHYRSALLWGGGFGLLVVSSVAGYSIAYPDVKDRLNWPLRSATTRACARCSARRATSTRSAGSPCGGRRCSSCWRAACGVCSLPRRRCAAKRTRDARSCCSPVL